MLHLSLHHSIPSGESVVQLKTHINLFSVYNKPLLEYDTSYRPRCLKSFSTLAPYRILSIQKAISVCVCRTSACWLPAAVRQNLKHFIRHFQRSRKKAVTCGLALRPGDLVRLVNKAVLFTTIEV